MAQAAQFFNPSEAAAKLGVSTKALRHYEERGLLVPVRTSAGWRTYGPAQMTRAAEIVTLRALGLSLGQVADVLGGEPESLIRALGIHPSALERQALDLADTLEKVRRLRTSLARGLLPTIGDFAGLVPPATEMSVAFDLPPFDLPWPWGGERLELRGIRPLNYITGPLGSGKTRLALKIAEALPGAAFLGLDRLADDCAAAQEELKADRTLQAKVDEAMAWLVSEGATASPSLTALLASLECDRSAAIVVDMVEEGLDQASQQALMAYLRRRGPGARPLFLMTRSNAILDLAEVTREETIILCPANHSPPIQVAPYPGSPGYEAVATCLASPEVRARTQGVITWRPKAG